MAKYEVTHSCGHKATYDLVGKEEKRKWRISKLEEAVCPDCGAKLLLEKAKELGLPELKGSEKQIKWANELRMGFIPELERRCEAEMFKQQRLHKKIGSDDLSPYIAEAFDQIKNESSAKWWIDHRDGTLSELKAMVEDMVREKKESTPNALQELAERTLEPEKKESDILCEINLREQEGETYLVLKSEYDNRIPAIAKAKGLKWDGRVWSRKMTVMTGEPNDRAAELGNALLNAGFPIRIDKELHQKTIKAEYEPENKRWVLKHAGYSWALLLCWEKGEDDIYRAACKISGAKWDSRRNGMKVPVQSYEELAEFSTLNGFKYSSKATERIEEYKATIIKVSPSEGRTAEYGGETEALEGILNSSRDVLEDLKEEE